MSAVQARENARPSRVRVDQLRAHPRNIRTDLGDLRELTASIRAEGVLVPLMVEDLRGVLRILHGHRRCAAARLAGLTRVPAFVVAPHSDEDALFLMLAEDKKEPADQLGRTRAIRALHDDMGFHWGQIADRLGVPVGQVKQWYEGREDGSAPSRMLVNPRGVSHTIRRAPRRAQPRRPKVGPVLVHQLLDRYERGEVTEGRLVAEMRGWLGGWSPELEKVNA